METNQTQAGSNTQLLWFAGAVGTAVGVAVWAYSRRELSYWDRTKRVVGDVADSIPIPEVNPWAGAAAGAVALGCAALAYQRGQRRSPWENARDRADEFLSQTGKQLSPWAGILASAAMSVASAAYNSKTRRRSSNAMVTGAASAANQFAVAGARLWKRLQVISGEAGKMYPQVRKLVA